MKNSKLRRALMLVACAVMLVSLSVGATLAYLTAQTGMVTNTFTVGTVSFDASAGLDEAKVDVYGVPQKKDTTDPDNLKDAPVADAKDAYRVTANTYKLIPGHKYVKDPTVHISASSEDGYLFVKVVNGIAGIEATGDTTIAKQMETLGWTSVGDETNYPGVYYYKTKVSASQDIVVFNNFTLKGDADVAKYANATITIQAYLVQADGFSSATDAWTNASLDAWKVTTPAGGTDPESGN